jgi:hypothetical protein
MGEEIAREAFRIHRLGEWDLWQYRFRSLLSFKNRRRFSKNTKFCQVGVKKNE